MLKVGGKFEVITPHFSNPYFYSDPTHLRFFGLYTMSFFSIDEIHNRGIPDYGNRGNLKLNSVDLIFKSERPRYISYAIKKFIGYFFNFNNFMRELYEEWFCYLFPAYEVRYMLTKIKDVG